MDGFDLGRSIHIVLVHRLLSPLPFDEKIMAIVILLGVQPPMQTEPMLLMPRGRPNVQVLLMMGGGGWLGRWIETVHFDLRTEIAVDR